MVDIPESPGGPANYYSILGVEKTADQTEIKKAYRKKALQLHPDKVGDTPENVERFQQLQKAYDTLSDEDSRKIYDQYGEKGLNMVNSAPFLDPYMFRLLNKFLFSCALFAGLMIIFWAFLAARLDNKTSWNWALVFIPLFILDAFLFLGLVSLDPSAVEESEVRKERKAKRKAKKEKAKADKKAKKEQKKTEANNTDDTETENDANTTQNKESNTDKESSEDLYDDEDNFSDISGRKARKIFLFFKYPFQFVLALLIIFQAFVVVRLNNTVTWSWGVVFIPIFILELIGVLGSILHVILILYRGKLIHEYIDEESGPQTEREPTIKRFTFAESITILFDELGFHLILIAQFILIVLKADGTITSSWATVFIPIWVCALFMIFSIILSYIKYRYLLGITRKLNTLSDDADASPAVQQAKISLILSTFAILFFGFLLYLFMGLLTRRLDHQGSNPNRPTVAAILSPFFILFGLMFCCCGCFLPCVVLGGKIAAEEDQFAADNNNNEKADSKENKSSSSTDNLNGSSVVLPDHRIEA